MSLYIEHTPIHLLNKEVWISIKVNASFFPLDHIYELLDPLLSIFRPTKMWMAEVVIGGSQTYLYIKAYMT